MTRAERRVLLAAMAYGQFGQFLSQLRPGCTCTGCELRRSVKALKRQKPILAKPRRKL